MSGYGRGSGAAGAAIFVGNLPNDIREREVEDLFIKYGRVRSIDLKTPPRPPAFAFVEFDDARDAQDAVRGRDGYDFFGNRIRVELSNGSREMGRGGGRGGGGGAPPPQTFRGRGTGFRALVKGLPISCSWQDLKDHFRQVVKPSYTNVFKERNGVLGVVEFDTREDLDRAIRKLDDTKFENPFDSAYVRVIDDSEGGGARRRSRSRSRGRSVSRGRNSPSRRAVAMDRSSSRSASPRSRSRSRSKSLSRARSPAKSASRSPVRSASRSPSRSPARS